jgi:hypothetical protein
MARNLSWRIEGRLVVVVHGHLSPTNLEWQRFLVDAVSSAAYSNPRVVVLSRGGAPDAHQRQAMKATLGSRPQPVAMLTDSVLVRTAIAAMRFFNSSTKAFSTKGFEEASEYLGLNGVERERAAQLMVELERELGGSATDEAPTQS